MKIETIEISGFAAALETLRLPFSLPVRSEICYTNAVINDGDNIELIEYKSPSYIYLNTKDKKLMKSLVLNGDDHAKFARMIKAYCNITGSRSIWQEMVTYEVGTTKGNSNSTMHTLLNEGAKNSDFDIPVFEDLEIDEIVVEQMNSAVQALNKLKQIAVDNQSLKSQVKRAMKVILPDSKIQTRTYCFSYQTLKRMYNQRKNHELPEWRVFCGWIESLPLAKELITLRGGNQ